MGKFKDGCMVPDSSQSPDMDRYLCIAKDIQPPYPFTEILPEKRTYMGSGNRDCLVGAGLPLHETVFAILFKRKSPSKGKGS